MMFSDLGFKRILDVGANQGLWSRAAAKLFPEATFQLVEANPGCEAFLKCNVSGTEDSVTLCEDRTNPSEKFPYVIALVGAEPKLHMPFYTLGPTATGASVYRETATGLYDHCKPIFLPQTTLDLLFPDDAFDLIKLDTQGSEIDILRGAERLRTKADAIRTEVSVDAYNMCAPLKPEVIDYMLSIGFPHWYVLDELRFGAQLIQQDILFVREKLRD